MSEPAILHLVFILGGKRPLSLSPSLTLNGPAFMSRKRRVNNFKIMRYYLVIEVEAVTGALCCVSACHANTMQTIC